MPSRINRALTEPARNSTRLNLIIYFWPPSGNGRRLLSAAMRCQTGTVDLCLMNYPSRRGIRLNPKQVDGRRGGWGKLIQTTRCPRSFPIFRRFSPFSPLPSPGSPSFIRPPPAYRDWRKAKVFEVISPSYLADQNAERCGN